MRTLALSPLLRMTSIITPYIGVRVLRPHHLDAPGREIYVSRVSESFLWRRENNLHALSKLLSPTPV